MPAKAPFSPEATNYFSRLDAAGDTTYVDYKQPLANYIDSLVTLGGAYWDDMLSSTSFVGVGIQGVTVPLRDGMTVPTQNNFVPGDDLDVLTGLKSASGNEYILTGLDGTDFSQNDVSISAYVTETAAGWYCGTGASTNLYSRDIGTANRNTIHGAPSNDNGTILAGFVGGNRSDSGNKNTRSNDTNYPSIQASTAPSAGDFSVFGAGGTQVLTTGLRLATYHAGPALDLATLEGLQATLLAEIRTAHTFVAAASYFSRLAAAGDTTHVAYKQPLTNYITSLVELGGAYWDDMESSTSFVGVGIQGITVPLRDGMPSITNNNFVAGDLDQLTGLLGDASTKYIDTGLIGTDLSQDDASISSYITSADSRSVSWFPIGNSTSGVAGAMHILAQSGSTLYGRCHSGTKAPLATVDTTTLTGFVGISRDNSADFDWDANGSSGTIVDSSAAPGNTEAISVFASSSLFLTSARLATYHAGPALDLATLEGLQATLLSEIRTAHTFVAAASYFSRLAAAGDTTHVAYKQPLTNYITSLVELGGAYWDDMLSAASFVGVGIQGITVPLRDGMTVPTQSNFVADDLDQLTGLKGDASTKLINTGYIDSDLAQNDGSLSTYVTAPATVNNTYYAGTTTVGNTGTFLRDVSNSCQLNVHGGLIANGTDIISGLVGASRTDSTNVNARSNQTNYPFTDTSTTPTSDALQIFARSSANRSDARLATYHAGPALNLATLEALQDTLITEIAAI